MIKRIKFNKKYIVEPMFGSDNPRLKIKKYKLGQYDRGYREGKRFSEYLYIPLFKKGFEVEFKPSVNVIIGDNGCGKSQLMKILSDMMNGKRHRYPLDCEFEMVESESMGFDFESDALKNLVKPNPESPDFVNDTLIVMDSDTKSHGENTKMLLDYYDGKRGKVLFMDEPENGLDLTSQVNLAETIKILGKYNQVIVVTHNKLIIEAFDEVFDLNRGKWTTPDELFKHLKL